MPTNINASRPVLPHRREADGSLTPLLFLTSADLVAYDNPDVADSGETTEEALNILFKKVGESSATTVFSAVLTTYYNASPEAAFNGAETKTALDELFRRLALLEDRYLKPSVETPSIISPTDGTVIAEEPFAITPESSPFSATQGGRHSASEWRICAGTAPETALWSSGVDLVNLTTHPAITLDEATVPGLDAATADGGRLLLSVRYRATNVNGETWSEWSAPASFTLQTEPPVPDYVIYKTPDNGETFTVPDGVTELAVLVVPSGGCSSTSRVGGVGGYAGAARVTVTPGEGIAITLPTGSTANPGAAFGSYVTCSNTGVSFAPDTATALWQCKTGDGGSGRAPGSGTSLLKNGGSGGGFRWQTDEDWLAFVLAGPGDEVPRNGGPASTSTSGSAGKSVGNGGATYGGGAGGSGAKSPAVRTGNPGIIVVLWGSLLSPVTA